MKKKILCFLPILLFIFLLPACTKAEQISYDNSIVFALSISNDGAISQTITFPTQEEEMRLSEAEVEVYRSELTRQIKTSLFFSYFYNFYKISATIPITEYKIGGEMVNYTLPMYNEEKQTIAFTFNFAYIQAWDLSHPSSETEEDGYQIESGIFVDKGVSSGDFLFSQKIKKEDREIYLGEYFVEILSTVQANYFDGKISKPSFIYQYSHYSNKIYTNADQRIESLGEYINIWKAEFEELVKEKKIEIYTYSPNRWLWYSLALGGTLLSVCIVCLIYYLKTHKKRKKEN